MWRYGTGNVPITAIGMLTYGIIMLGSPESSYANPAFKQGPFSLVDKNGWAIAMIVSSLLALSILHYVAVFPLLFVVTAWGLSLMIVGIGLPAVSPTAGLAWMMITTMLLVGVARRGVRTHRAPPK